MLPLQHIGESCKASSSEAAKLGTEIKTPGEEKGEESDYVRHFFKNSVTVPDLTERVYVINAHKNKHLLIKMCLHKLAKLLSEGSNSILV